MGMEWDLHIGISSLFAYSGCSLGGSRHILRDGYWAIVTIGSCMERGRWGLPACLTALSRFFVWFSLFKVDIAFHDKYL